MQSFSIVHREALPHGLVVGVSLPPGNQPLSNDTMDRLLPKEREVLEGLQGHRRVQFAGGRIAAHAAMKTLGHTPTPLLIDSWGAPVTARGLAVSITHKEKMAYALVARDRFGQIGVDYETIEPHRLNVASRVLRPEELKQVEALPEENRWVALLQRFSIKEAIYKALAPRLQRYIGFDEARVVPGTDGSAKVDLFLNTDLRPQELDARYHWVTEGILSSVRVRWPSHG